MTDRDKAFWFNVLVAGIAIVLIIGWSVIMYHAGKSDQTKDFREEQQSAVRYQNDLRRNVVELETQRDQIQRTNDDLLTIIRKHVK